MNKVWRIIKKYYEYIVTKIKLRKEQKVFDYEGTHIKYILRRNEDSRTLIVVFSACTRKGIKARYNYLKTLDSVHDNKLYILDDFSEDGRGSYYIGADWTFDEEKATRELINSIRNTVMATKVVFCGSSKGGYAAINFGLEYPNANIVVGAPQYFLGSYLETTDNMDALKHIAGKDYYKHKDELDVRLKNKIYCSEYTASQRIYIHYSNKEHTYEEHVKDLLCDLRRNGCVIFEEVATYENHGDLSYYFPDFLRKSLREIELVEDKL